MIWAHYLGFVLGLCLSILSFLCSCLLFITDWSSKASGGSFEQVLRVLKRLFACGLSIYITISSRNNIREILGQSEGGYDEVMSKLVRTSLFITVGIFVWIFFCLKRSANEPMADNHSPREDED